MDYAKQVEYIKSLFNLCKNHKERRQVFFMFATDMSYSRASICQAIKELAINDDMTLKKEGE